VVYAIYIFRRRQDFYRIHELSQNIGSAPSMVCSSSSMWKSRANLPFTIKIVHWIYGSSTWHPERRGMPLALYTWLPWAMRYATGFVPFAFLVGDHGRISVSILMLNMILAVLGRFSISWRARNYVGSRIALLGRLGLS
jgi:hypothetical protein